MKPKKTKKHLDKELWWDQTLKIQTTGRDDSMEDVYHHPYEPTPYCVLERLAESGYIDKENVVLDYGCGKGRVGCFLHHQLGCKTIGVEFDKMIWRQACDNARSYQESHDQRACDNVRSYQVSHDPQSVTVVCADAATHEVTDADRFYFFNPFSVEVLRSVWGRILESYYIDPREMLLFLYYPDEEYVAQLMTQPEVLFVDEVDCRDLFDGKDDREKILIFEVCG